ncbi:hypothetical protein LPJ56_000754 [Coemansia sp. RSA 2599]|nr:hypothetical protein LPJ75_000330 [Coemansia sp. RSA 2598]KAJ1828964.1 hypothetical protein LPJ56_000754 [Coemansia sp. RSA 2599]
MHQSTQGAAAQGIPAECLHGILDYLWDDQVVGEFFKRRRRRTRDYDQTLVHRVLRARSIAPLHVCRSWRASSIARFFRNLLVDSAGAVVPEAAHVLTERLFLVAAAAPGDRIEILAAHLGVLSHVRVLAICHVDGGEEFLRGLDAAVPRLEHMWVQSTGRVTPTLHAAVLALRGKTGARVSMVHLCFGGTQDPVAVDLLHNLSDDIETLCLGRISGGVLGDLVHGSTTQQISCTAYPRLRRLVFSVDIHANLFVRPIGRSRLLCGDDVFPVLRDLHFDDSALRGAPREEWHAPLFDSLIKYAGGSLRSLTFPIVYNTGRTVNSRNCPRLIELRHVKCCWATGPWAVAQQRASDSTRVLTDIASIPTLKRYVHPSYIARLSDLPAQVECRGLSHLDLFGWPLTVRNVTWVLQTFAELRVLRVTVAASAGESDDGGPADGGAGRVLALRRLDIGAVDNAVPSAEEMPRLAAVVETLPGCCRVALFGAAYLYVKTHVAAVCLAANSDLDKNQSQKHRALLAMRLFNLDSAAYSSYSSFSAAAIAGTGGLGSRADSGISTPWQAVGAERSVAGSNGWHLVSRLLIE